MCLVNLKSVLCVMYGNTAGHVIPLFSFVNQSHKNKKVGGLMQLSVCLLNASNARVPNILCRNMHCVQHVNLFSSSRLMVFREAACGSSKNGGRIFCFVLG